MPDRIITAEAVISAKDATGDVFINIARKLGEVGKSAKASAEVERLSKSLSDASKQAEKIGQFRVASKTLDVASLSMAKARQNAAQLAAQIAGMDKPTATLTGKLNQAEREVTRATEAFKRQGQAVRDARGVLDAAGIPLGKLGTEQTRLKGVIEGTTRALEHQIGVERQAAEMSAKVAEAEKREAAARAQAERVAERAAHQRQHDIDHHGIGNYVAGAAAGAVSAHGVMSALERALEAGAERQTTIIGMKNAGMGDAEIQRAVDLATRVSRDAPNLDISQILELHKEARSGVSHPEEAFELMPDLARATSVLKGSGADNANIADIVKGGESLGLMNDPKRFHAYLDAQVRAMKVMGKTITTEQIYEAAKYSKAAGGTLSDDFLNLTMPSLIQEMHGSSAGDALSSLTKTLRGGLQHKHVPVTRLQELGLLEDPSQIRRSKSGEILGYTGKVKGDDLLSTDPDRWFLEYFDKAAESHGYTKLADKTKLLSETLPGTAANLGRIVIQQRESLTNHRQLYRNAPGLEQSVDLQQHDPKVAMQTFTAALNDLEAAVTGPTMDALSLGLGHLSGLFRDLADAAKEHPNIAVGVGAGVAGAGLVASGTLAYYVSTGFGLPSAAAQLEAAALHLQGTGGVPGGGAPGESTKPGASGGGSKSLLGGGGLSGFFGFSATALVQKFLYDQVAGLQDRVLGWTPKNQATLDHATTLSNVVKDVKEQWFGGSADPAAADRDARLRRTERQRLMREPLEGGLDRMRAEMTGENAPLPPPRPMTASGFHPDDDRATRSRASDADVWIQQQDMIRAASQQFGALNDKTGVLQASFTTLDGGSDAAAQQIALLGLAARTVAGAMAGMLSGGGSGGSGSGIISASYEGGGFGGGGSGGSSFGGRVAPNLRRGRPHGIGGSGWSPSPSDPTFAGAPDGSGFDWGHMGVQMGAKAAYLGNHLQGIGMSQLGAAAMLGHASVESNFKVDAHNGHLEDSHGLFQWNDGVGRWSGLKRWAAANGRNPNDPLAQLDYAKVESMRMHGPGGRSVWDAMQHAGSLAEANKIWMDHFEAPKVRDYGNRLNAGQKALGAMRAFAGKVPSEHPALASKPLPRREPAPEQGAHLTTVRLEQKMDRMVQAVERGGLHRVHVTTDKHLKAEKAYSRGSLGMTTA